MGVTKPKAGSIVWVNLGGHPPATKCIVVELEASQSLDAGSFLVKVVGQSSPSYCTSRRNLTAAPPTPQATPKPEPKAAPAPTSAPKAGPAPAPTRFSSKKKKRGK